MQRPVQLGAALLCDTLVTDRSVLIAVQPGPVSPFLLGRTIHCILGNGTQLVGIQVSCPAFCQV